MLDLCEDSPFFGETIFNDSVNFGVQNLFDMSLVCKIIFVFFTDWNALNKILMVAVLHLCSSVCIFGLPFIFLCYYLSFVLVLPFLYIILSYSARCKFRLISFSDIFLTFVENNHFHLSFLFC